MVHLNQSFLTASGALATRGTHSFLDVPNPVSSEATQNQSSKAKQRRLSKPNSAEELHHKCRRQDKKLKEKKHRLKKCEAKMPEGLAKGCKLMGEVNATTLASILQIRSQAEFSLEKMEGGKTFA